MKPFAAVVLTLIVVSCFSLLILLSTLKTTILSRDSVKSWVSSSGAYDNALKSFLSTRVVGDEALITNDIFQKSIENTFPSTYVKEGAETVINSFYDWLDGHSDKIAFHIPVNEKRDALIENLAVLIEERLKTLPACDVRSSVLDPNTACMPSGISAKAYAADVAELSVDSSGLLTVPISQEDIIRDLPGKEAIQLFTKNITLILTVVLPILAIAALWLRIIIAAPGKKMSSINNMASQVTISAMLSFLVGATALMFGANLKLAPSLGLADSQQKMIVEQVVDPIISQALPAIGGQLMMFGGAVMILGFMGWLGPRATRRLGSHKRRTNPAGLTKDQFPTYPVDKPVIKPSSTTPSPFKPVADSEKPNDNPEKQKSASGSSWQVPTLSSNPTIKDQPNVPEQEVVTPDEPVPQRAPEQLDDSTLEAEETPPQPPTTTNTNQ